MKGKWFAVLVVVTIFALCGSGISQEEQLKLLSVDIVMTHILLYDYENFSATGWDVTFAKLNETKGDSGKTLEYLATVNKGAVTFHYYVRDFLGMDSENKCFGREINVKVPLSEFASHIK